MSDKSSEESDSVSVEAEASGLLRTLAAPAIPGERVAAAIGRAGRRAGLTFGRAKGLWYGEARAILAEEMDRLRARASMARKEQTNADRAGYRDLIQRLDALELGLSDVRSRLAGEVSPREGEGDDTAG